MTLVDALLALGTVAIVPLGTRLGPDGPPVATPVTVAAGALAAVGIALAPGTWAVVLVLPWFLVVATAATTAAIAWLRSGRRAGGLGWPIALGYLTFGAGWLVAHALDLRPGGVAPPFVELTAVHFHYAGFVASLYALLTHERAVRWTRTAGVSAVAVLTAPPVIAVGFVSVGVLQIVGAALLTAGLFGVAWVAVADVRRSLEDAPARLLLTVSSLTVLVPMLLAVQWAVGNNLGTPALSIPAMARTHGVANAIGFAGLGMLGWWRVGPLTGSRPRPPRHG